MSDDDMPRSETALHNTLLPYLTADRLGPYLQAAGGNRREAIKLYQWNVELSGAVYEALHIVEVVLRNAMDAQLSAWHQTQVDPATGQPYGADWLLDPAPLLARLFGASDLAKARSRAANAVRTQRRTVSGDGLHRRG